MSISVRAQVVLMWKAGHQLKRIQAVLQEEGTQVSKTSLCLLIKKFKNTGSVADNRIMPRPRKLDHEHLKFIDECMASNNELSITRLHHLVRDQFPSLSVSQSTVKRARRELGWMAKKTRYCALISDKNQEARVEWCKKQQRESDLEFENVLWTDECTVQLESHRLITFRKEGQPVVYRMRPKHPPKVHVWAGISRRGSTQVVVFTGTMTATRYVKILEAALLPFLKKNYPDGHRYMQDNDPKHTSLYAREWYKDNGVNWWKTPASSPDLNPIENVWHSMKEYLRSDYKPRNVTQLKEGIRTFWRKMEPDVCARFIGHLKKVIPKCIEVNGGPTGY